MKPIKSGTKYRNSKGQLAIKDGIKSIINNKESLRIKKPKWLSVKILENDNFLNLKSLVRKNNLNTVCEEAKCPNIYECWGYKTATIMILGSVCTRACRFCSVDTGNPNGFIDVKEPKNCAKTVKWMDLFYVVITSVDRDDLKDGGAGHYANCVKEIKKISPKTKIECLTPDFQGNKKSIETVLDSGINVFSQNIETVKRLTKKVRDIRSGYEQTLDVLDFAKKYSSKIRTKTGIMLGLGEKESEILDVMNDLRKINVDFLTIGQYLQPTKNHISIKEFVSPKKFNRLKKIALKKGFLNVESSPLVRSSYRSDKLIKYLF